MTNYEFYQYPRGENNGGFLRSSLCPTITISAWQYNYFLIEEYD